MDERLQHAVFERLQAEGVLDNDWSTLVIAACTGSADLDSVLETPAGHDSPAPEPPAQPENPRGAFLKSITVQGFRGIGPEATLDLNPGPGLTLVVGRNGSGKSSFAEGLEVLLTGDSKRWQGRSKVWKEGWRNLHHSNPTLVEADLLVEDEGPARATREWKADDELESPTTTVQPHGKTRTDLSFLGWNQALVTYRPFLSYNELGSMLDEGPAKLYDAIATVLGLEELVTAQTLLQQARLGRTNALKRAKEQATPFIEQISEIDDERGAVALDALRSKPWDLDALEQVVTVGSEASESVLGLLRRASTIEGPNAERIASVCDALDKAAAAVDQVAGTDAEKARQVASVLTSALVFHEQHHEEDCPVCGTSGVLGEDWKRDASQQLERLQQEAQLATDAHQQMSRAVKEARELCAAPPGLLDSTAEVGLDPTSLKNAWQRWCSEGASITDARELSTYLRDNFSLLTEALGAFKKRAAAELDRREDAWRPVAVELSGWIPDARAALAGHEKVPDIKSAEEWLKDATGSIRNERFLPIAQRSLKIWERLKQNSNVALEDLSLQGTGTQRRVTLDVNVDGTKGAALGVMSQGELNSLALSLFLPRATLDESPFRFVVIDDPVQSMDPSRVDGLARTLEDAAATRQVIVFTHDERLPESVRRLGIDANVIAVTRRSSSVIELRAASHPVKNHIDDAMTLVLTKELTDAVRKRVVPTFCRSAVEASCYEVIRRRRLGAGKPHEEVEEALRNANRLSAIAALALFDDGGRGGDVMGRLNQFGGWAGDVFKAMNKGAHEGYPGDLKKLVQDAEQLCKKILTLN